MTLPTFSFEFFPPKTEAAAADLSQAAGRLAALGPSFMTVTYGAGGSTRDGTLTAATRLARETQMPMAAHLTFCGTPKAELDAYIDRLWDEGIHHLIALRGDLPAGKAMADFAGDEFYHFTSDFVTALRQRHPFEISVGAYPEKHPDAPSLNDDIEALRKKCAAGATRAITQFFFDNNVYYRFLDLVAAAGISTPVIPGLLPIVDFPRMVKFATQCGASVPQPYHTLFNDLVERPAEAHKLATELLTLQMEDLIRHGVPHLHLYTLNRAEIPLTACMAVGLHI